MPPTVQYTRATQEQEALQNKFTKSSTPKSVQYVIICFAVSMSSET